ncbi:MAG: T9SS type A sorting domain-containing protein [Flavobacteriales bacterium]|nr:T9SS type A sorting domain-containing protein [Flavobacteriales bacterium]
MNDQGEVALAGYYAGSITIGSPISGYLRDDPFFPRRDTSDNVQGAFGIGANDHDRASAVAMGAEGATYLGGYFNNTIDLDPGLGTSRWTMMGSYDLFVARYDGLSTAITDRTTPMILAAPNPTADVVRLQVSEPGSAHLIDATGQVIRVVQLDRGPNALDLSALPDGIYLLRCGVATVRVAKL